MLRLRLTAIRSSSWSSGVTQSYSPHEVFDLKDIVKGRFRLREGGELGDVYASERIKRDANGYVDYTPGQSLVTEPNDVLISSVRSMLSGISAGSMASPIRASI